MGGQLPALSGQKQVRHFDPAVAAWSRRCGRDQRTNERERSAPALTASQRLCLFAIMASWSTCSPKTRSEGVAAMLLTAS